MESQHVYHFVGTCVNSFDEDDGTCSFRNYQDVSDFAQAEENAEIISQSDFESVVNVPPHIWNDLRGHKLIFMRDSDRDVNMIYDDSTDIHYFFVR